MRETRTWHIEPHRVGAGGEEQCIVDNPGAVDKLQVPTPRIERSDGSIQLQVDAMRFVEREWTQGIRLHGRGASEEAFRQVGPVTRA